VRKSWFKVFDLDELCALADIGLIEDPEEMLKRTFLFDQLQAALKKGGDLPNESLPFPEIPCELANPTQLYLEEMKRQEEMMIYSNVHVGTMDKIQNLCMPSLCFRSGPEIPMAGESQLLYARMMEVERIPTLHRFGALGLDRFQQMLSTLMVMDEEVCVGRTDFRYSDMGLRERMLLFLDAVNVCGEELLTLSDEAEFRHLVDAAIEKEEKQLKIKAAE